MRPILLRLLGLRVTAVAVAAALVMLGALHLLGCSTPEAPARSGATAAAPAQYQESVHDACCAGHADLPAVRTPTRGAPADLVPAPAGDAMRTAAVGTLQPAARSHLPAFPPSSVAALLLNCVSRT
jgi:hypothetical protein